MCLLLWLLNFKGDIRWIRIIIIYSFINSEYTSLNFSNIGTLSSPRLFGHIFVHKIHLLLVVVKMLENQKKI